MPPDPITSIVTVVSEHPQAAAAVASIYGVAKPFLAKLLGPSAEELGEIGRDYVKGYRAANTSRTLVNAAALLEATGREAQAVPLKVLEPLLNAASLEDEVGLTDKWAALLANAADPARRVPVQPAFAEVLRQLTTTDALILQDFYYPAGVQPERLPTGFRMLKQFLTLGLTYDAIGISVDNLLRLRLCVDGGGKPAPMSGTLASPSTIISTAFGTQFMLACTPPAA